MKRKIFFILVAALCGLLFFGASLRFQVIQISSPSEKGDHATINRLVFPWKNSADVPKPLFGEYLVTTYSYYGLRTSTEQFFYAKPAAPEPPPQKPAAIVPSRNTRLIEVRVDSNSAKRFENEYKTQKK